MTQQPLHKEFSFLSNMVVTQNALTDYLDLKDFLDSRHPSFSLQEHIPEISAILGLLVQTKETKFLGDPHTSLTTRKHRCQTLLAAADCLLTCSDKLGELYDTNTKAKEALDDYFKNGPAPHRPDSIKRFYDKTNERIRTTLAVYDFFAQSFR